MKTKLQIVARFLIAASTGFILAGMVARLAKGTAVNQESAHPHSLPPKAPASAAANALPAPGSYAKLSPLESIAISERAALFSPEERTAALAEAVKRNEPEPTALLRLILLGWAENNPSAAADWVMEMLADRTRESCLSDIAESWAAKDPNALAKWWNETATRQPPLWPAGTSTGPSLTYVISNILLRNDLQVFAQLKEMDCCYNPHSGGSADHILSHQLATPQQIAKVAAILQGNVSYISDTDHLRQDLEITAATRHANKKNTWNVMFEETAVAWYRHDPAACDAWLSTFPENAQVAARHFISKDEQKNTIPPGASEATQVVATVESTPPTQQLATAPPIAGPAEDAARNDWAAWWRTDAAAAEAFLNSAAWSENQKFRARARAYSSPP